MCLNWRCKLKRGKLSLFKYLYFLLMASEGLGQSPITCNYGGSTRLHNCVFACVCVYVNCPEVHASCNISVTLCY